MGQLIVRNLDDSLVLELKKRAAASGRSAEEEHRQILRDALLGPAVDMGLKEYLLLESGGLPDLEIPERNHPDERKDDFE